MKVLLIDDHAMFREGVALLLAPMLAGLSTHQAGSCEEALAWLDGEGAPDLVLIDMGLPGMSGLDGISAIRERLAGVPIVALSSSDDEATVLQALDAGAMGFIPKSSSSRVLIGALHLILAGGVYLPPSVFLPGRAGLATGRMPAPAAAPAPQDAPAAATQSAADLGLTERQAQVLQLILQGKPAKLIARDLDLSASTVKSHTSAVLRALNVTTRTQAVVAAGQLGLRLGAPGQPLAVPTH